MRDEIDDLYYDVGTSIQELIQMILGPQFEVWRTGTINPDYYEGHKKMGDMGGLQLTITIPKFNPYPTMEQIENYFKRFKE